MGSTTAVEVRYTQGDRVWVSPSNSGQWVSDDEAVILEDLGSGYLVLQDTERVPSHGHGHFVCDVEVELLFTPQTPQRGEVLRERRLWEFNTRAKGILGGARCDRGRQKRVLVHN
jgi:hypothetical protein